MPQLVASKTAPPVGALIAAKAAPATKVNVKWGEETALTLDGGLLGGNTSAGIARCIARLAGNQSGLYGTSVLEKTEVDHWLTFSLGPLTCSGPELEKALLYLDGVLQPTTFLVGQKVSIGDYAVFGALVQCPVWLWTLTAPEGVAPPAHLARWYNMMAARPEVTAALATVPQEGRAKATAPSAVAKEKKEESAGGKFVELPGAEMGKVVVRFPPEASGFLHVGHAKAALLNNYYKESFEGKLIMRFDDTNPAKEKEEYEEVILEDLKLLQVRYDHFSRTSDHFDTIMGYCDKLIKIGKAYVDDTDAETMKIEREAKQDSKHRNNSVDKNMKMWEEMKKGSEVGLKCAVRAKIDMQSLNGCMRDPTIYRCKIEEHPSTGTKYKVYPTYDFACPIVDSVEGVTHALRTTEYMDRDDQFKWFIDALGIRKPHIWAYARLNLTNTVMSKRKLTWLVDEGIVDGWDDPRLPTVRGILRRGLTVEALKQFIIAQGSSRSVVFMEWDKIWGFNKKVIDPVVPRHTTVDKVYNVPVRISGAKLSSHKSPCHPKNPDVGEKTIWTGPEIIIDGVDAEALKEGENATFINWGNLMIKKVNKEGGKVTSVDATDNTENKDFKKTLKLTWLCVDEEKSAPTPAVVIYYDHIVSKPILDKDDDFKSFVDKDTKVEIEMIGDPELRNLKKGDMVQIQRRGYFICDVEYRPFNPATGRSRPVVLIAIPDGTPSSYGPPGKAKAPAPAPSKGKAAKGGKQEGGKGGKRDATPKKEAASPVKGGGDDAAALSAKVAAQGDKVRAAKEAKATKDVIGEEVKVLLALKAEYKAATGQDWKPGAAPAPSNDAEALNGKITAAGDKVRELKGAKAGKDVIDEHVKVLLALKAEYKAATGKDWKPGAAPAAAAPAKKVDSGAGGGDAAAIDAKIKTHGDLVRKLKSDKAAKTEIDAAVKDLLSAKAEFKAATGLDWKPGMEVPKPAAPAAATTPAKKVDSGAGGGDAEAIDAKIKTHGDLVRKLKSDKAAKPEIDAAVKDLLAAKAEFKAATGLDWKPGMEVPKAAAKPAQEGSGGRDELSGKVAAQGDKVRQLKTNKAPKDEVDAAVKILLGLKAEYKTATGKDWAPAGGNAQTPKDKGKKKQEPKEKPVAPAAGVTRLGLEAKKAENLPDWYSQTLIKAEMMEYYDVSGCYILRPWSFSIWEVVKDFIDTEIKKLEVENCYFPIFVSNGALEREKDHIADFAPEVAWVTKSGETDLAEPIAIRPTSETVMYPAYKKWIQSHRDLPLKLNQWNNVVRWEFKHPQPFLRTREFLWQEGHTAFAKFSEAEEEVMIILDIYRRVYEELMAVPVVRGRKTEKEKFAGGDYTTTVEAYISASGRAIQGGTSHHLGLNFSKMFDITFEDPETGEKKFVYQNSWGFTTRSIGVLVMVHGDDKGLVLPPKIACVQVVIVPCGITNQLKDNDREALYAECKTYAEQLRVVGVRVKLDLRENYSPGWKFNHWELKGVPIRLECGPKDMKNAQYVAVRRDTGEKLTMRRAGVKDDIPALLDTIQSSLFAKARTELSDHLVVASKWEEFLQALDKKCLIQAPFCGDEKCEDEIKDGSKRDENLEPGAPSMGAKSLCIPFKQPGEITPDLKCIRTACNKKPKFYTMFGRSY